MRLNFNDVPLKFCAFLVSLFLILNMPTVYLKNLATNYHLELVLLVTVFMTALIVLIQAFYNKINLKVPVITILIYEILILIYFVFKILSYRMEFIETYGFYIPLFFLINFLLTKTNKTFLIIDYIYKWTVLFAAVSLIMWFLVSISGLLKFDGNVWMDWGTIRQIPSFHNIYFQTQIVSVMGTNVVRNTGIFCEAPMYSYVLVVSLFYKILFKKESNRLSGFILVATILSTLSTTGIIMMLYALLVAFLLKEVKKDRILIILKEFILVILAPLAVLLAIIAFMQKTKTGSFLTRMDDITGLLRYWKFNPIFGNGFNSSMNNVQAFLANRRSNNTGLSSGFFVTLADTGIFIMLVHMLYLILAFMSKNRKYIIFSTMIFALFIVTLVQYRPLYLYLIALCYNLYYQKGEA